MAELVIGLAVSYLLETLLTPDQKGPRVNNLKLQNSQYGEMIKLIFGTTRVAGNVIWQTDLTEHSHKSGGKGGPKVTTYTYTASFAVKLCKGPIIEVRNIWADKQLIWSTDNAATGDLPCKVYLGVETDGADPTMEAVLGVGEVPAFRDDAAVVFTDWLLTNYGNRIPNLEFEVVTNAGHRPARVSTYTRLFTGSTQGAISYDPLTGYTTSTLYDWFPGGSTSPNPVPYHTRVQQIDGTIISDDTEAVATVDGFNAFTMRACLNNEHIWYQFAGNDNGWFVDGVLSTTPIGSDYSLEVYGDTMAYHPDGYIFAIGIPMGGSATLWRYPVVNGVPSGAADRSIGVYDTNVAVTVSNDGFVYVARASDTIPAANIFQKYDVDLNLVHDWGTSQPFRLPSWTYGFALGFMVYDNLLLLVDADHTGTHEVSLFQMEVDDTFTYIGSTPIDNGILIPLGGGQASVPDGIVTIFPPPEPVTVGSVVAKISDLCDQSAYDVSLLTQLLYGYTIDQQMAGADMIQPLRNAYFFDAVECDNEVQFVPRGRPAVITIPDDDLAACPTGSTPPPLLTTERTADDRELPQIVYVGYSNLGAAYQQGTQQAQRLVTNSQLATTVSLPLVFYDQQAQLIADTTLLQSWIEREKFTFYTTRKYAQYVPTDVVVAHGRRIRITNVDDSPSTVLKFEGLAVSPLTYAQAGIAGPASGFRVPPPPKQGQKTQLVLLDIPLVNDTDASNGFYAAMAGASIPAWQGAGLYKSVDGSNFDLLLTSTTPDVIATSTTALGNFQGGNNFDEGNSVTVTISAGGGELVTLSELAVLNGGNTALLGAEIFQYKTATLVSTGVYTLSGLLRGRRGTEWAINTHAVGETFVELPTTTNPAAPAAELGLAREYEAVTLNTAASSADILTFTNNGNALLCYSPTSLGGGSDSSGNTTLQWIRRTRIGGQWMPYNDVPLSESIEEYAVQIWNSTYTACARIILVTSATTTTYTSAQQVTDFGAQQQTIYFSVAQIGAWTLGSQAYGTATGGGGSNGPPLAPIAPYVWIPNTPAPGGSNPISGTLSYPNGLQTVDSSIGALFVLQFTTAGSTPVGYITCYTSAAPVFIRARICTDSAGLAPVGGTTTAIAYGPMVTWGGANTALSPATTYYLVVDFQQSNGALSGLPGTVESVRCTLTASS